MAWPAPSSLVVQAMHHLVAGSMAGVSISGHVPAGRSVVGAAAPLSTIGADVTALSSGAVVLSALAYSALCRITSLYKDSSDRHISFEQAPEVLQVMITYDIFE